MPGFILPQLCSCWEPCDPDGADTVQKHGFAHGGQWLQASPPAPLSVLYEQWQGAVVRECERRVARTGERGHGLFLWLQGVVPETA